MAKYKEYDYSQGKFIPIHFDKQILPETFEHTLKTSYYKTSRPHGSKAGVLLSRPCGIKAGDVH